MAEESIPSLTIAAMRAEIIHNLPHIYKDDTAEVIRSRAWGLIHGAHLMLREANAEMRRANEIERDMGPRLGNIDTLPATLEDDA